MAPRMQVYVWSGEEEESITSQPGNRTAPANGPAAYGPANFDLTGLLIAGVDGTGASVTDGCETLTNAAAVAGKIALVERGNCSGESKAANAQAAGAIGVIIAHNVAGSPAPGLPNDPAVTTAITIPVVSVGFSDGATLRSDLGNGPVTVTMHRRVGAEADGGLDAGLVAHEFGHYVHHRLSQCGTRMCGAMSEGWADFIALLTIARDGDDLAGAYGTAAYAWNGDPYFGIRRVPYSTNMQKNALTFRHVTEGEPLPTNHPLAFGGSNSEVHNAGEVWSSALWEAYVGLQQARGGASFDDTRRKMQRYVVNGLLMTPTDATFTETRDAILAAAQAASPADHDVLAAGFARRGFGSCALSPDRDSADFFGAVESFDVKGHAFAGETTLVVDVTDCDSDDALDVGETATITVPIVNSGAQDLSGVTVSVATTTAGLTVITAPVVVGALASYASATASFQVRLDAVTGPAAGVLDVTIASPGGCTETQVVNVPIRLAADDTLLASANDAFDAATSPWTATGDGGNIAWRHASLTALDRYWRGADMGTVSDTQLVSPALIAGTGAVTVSFDHTYQFEFSDAFYDGGVIEISTDGGATWADVATMVDVPYNATLGTESGNPLGGAEAFGDTNPSFPASDRVTLDFGTQLSGRTFQLRFRIGTDQAIGGPGWAIDHVQTTGLTNTPFPTQGADAGACGDIVEPPGEEDGGCCSTGGGPGPVAPIGLGVVAAAILARRRRRTSI